MTILIRFMNMGSVGVANRKSEMTLLRGKKGRKCAGKKGRKCRRKKVSKKRQILLVRNRKAKRVSKQRIAAQHDKYVSVEDTTGRRLELGSDEEDPYYEEEKGQGRKWEIIEDPHCPRTRYRCFHTEEKNTTPMPPPRSVPLCSCLWHIQLAMHVVFAMRALLMCLERRNRGRTQVFSCIFGTHLFPFLSEADNIGEYLVLERENERKRFLFKQREHAPGIAMCISHWRRRLWSREAYEYKIKRWKNMFSLYDWKYFRSDLENLFPEV